jgi:hypothetical protein
LRVYLPLRGKSVENRLQIVTVQEILDGDRINLPLVEEVVTSTDLGVTWTRERSIEICG